jgi:peptide/nickel transport system permease protein
MGRYLVERLLYSVFVIFGVTIIVFLLVHLTGDPAVALMPREASPQEVEEFRHRMGFDQPLYEQYLSFLGRVAQGNFGYSYRSNEDALSLVIERIPATTQLATAAAFVALIISIPMGIISALKRNSFFDKASMAFALFGQCMPTFWLGILLILIVSVGFRLLPASGGGDFRHLVLPAITLGMYSAAVITRVLRSSLLDVMGKEYIRVARSKGLSEGHVLGRHALKNAAIPVVTVIGMQIASLLAGAIITETVFSYPGMGLLAIQAIRYRDIPVVQAFVTLVAVVVVTTNLIVDISYRYLDPRVRLG